MADAGSTKTPAVLASSFCAARMRASSIAPNQPCVASRASSASSHDAGLPMRMAEAIVSGLRTTSPRTRGAEPSAWKPNIRGTLVATPRAASSRYPREYAV